jgi:2-polyprenyl-3-methyl-5-hydroxy-6-metoxy-1,4-benzoquinol methylase
MADEEVQLDDFARYFPFTPTALCIKECARLRVLRNYDCPGPILDVGCGDGLFASIAYSRAEVWGIDIDAKEGRWAFASRAFSQIILGDITRASLPSSFFATCVANCSLEHVPRIDLALKNILESIRPGAMAFVFVPNVNWAAQFLSVRLLDRLGARGLARKLQGAVDDVFKHHHLYDQAGWQKIVTAAGFEVLEIKPVLSTATTVAFEMFLLPSLAGLLNKKMTTRWTNFPGVRRMMTPVAHSLVKAALAAAHDSTPTAEFLVVCKRPAR